MSKSKQEQPKKRSRAARIRELMEDSGFTRREAIAWLDAFETENKP